MRTCIRRGAFETNSSSTHSIVIMTKEEWEKLKNCEVYYNLTHTWDKYPDIQLVDPETNEKLPMLVPAGRYGEISRFEKKRHRSKWADEDDDDGDIFLSEQLINPQSREWHHAEAEELEDGKVKVDIDHYFG